jgi:hypothetical protein
MAAVARTAKPSPRAVELVTSKAGSGPYGTESNENHSIDSDARKAAASDEIGIFAWHAGSVTRLKPFRTGFFLTSPAYA